MGEKLKSVMERRNISQAQLAEAVGVSQTFMSYIIRGLKKPSVDVLKMMAYYLKVPMEELY